MNNSIKKRKPRCPNGQRRNPKTGNCEPVKKNSVKKNSVKKNSVKKNSVKKNSVKKNSVKNKSIIKKKKKKLIIINSNNKPNTTLKKRSPSPKKNSPPTKKKRCPNGTKRDPKTGTCVPVTKKSSVSTKPKSLHEIKNKTCIFHEMRDCLKVGKFLNPSPPGTLASKYPIYLCEKHRDAHCVIIPDSITKKEPKGIASCTTPNGGTYFFKVI